MGLLDLLESQSFNKFLFVCMIPSTGEEGGQSSMDCWPTSKTMDS